MITNKLIKITVRLYRTSLIVYWVAAASGDHEDELETLSRMTNTPTVHDDFASSLTSFFLSFKID